MTEFAVKVEEWATPLALVVSVSDAVPFPNVPLAPVVGAVKVTDTPLVGTPPVVAVTVSGAANGVPAVAVCGNPLVIMIATTRRPWFPLVTAPQLEKNAIKQTEAKIVPQALYSIGLPPSLCCILAVAATRLRRWNNSVFVPNRVDVIPTLTVRVTKNWLFFRIFRNPVASTS